MKGRALLLGALALAGCAERARDDDEREPVGAVRMELAPRVGDAPDGPFVAERLSVVRGRRCDGILNPDCRAELVITAEADAPRRALSLVQPLPSSAPGEAGEAVEIGAGALRSDVAVDFRDGAATWSAAPRRGSEDPGSLVVETAPGTVTVRFDRVSMIHRASGSQFRLTGTVTLFGCSPTSADTAECPLASGAALP